MRRLRLLVAEDSEDDFMLVQGELRAAGFELTAVRVEDAEQMRQALAGGTWDLVLSDFSMPQFDGMAALQTLKESARADTPFIIVSGSIGEIRAVEALKAGASNYVMKENLEKLVPVVERELKDAQIRREHREAFEALRRALKARDEFLSIVAHELKTPLTALSLQVQSLLKAFQKDVGGPPLTPEQMQAKAQSVARSSARLMVLIERLLDITRVTAGPIELIRDEVDLIALVREIAAGMEDALGDAGSTLVIRSPGSVVGHWDRERIEAVLTNLLMNAMKYGPGKPIDLDVEDGGEQVRVRVTDRGIGISPKDQQRIFTRFGRAVPDRNYGGFGVGLWLSKQIVEAHGGTIDVASVPGRGSTFTVALPKRQNRA